MKSAFCPPSVPSTWIVTALSLVAVGSAGHAQAVFTQNFSSSSTLTDYVGNGANQFSGINSGGPDFNWSLINGALQGTRSSANGGSSGSANKIGIASLAGGAASFAFDFNATTGTNTTNGTNDVVFQVGSGYTANSTGAQGAQTYAQFTIDLQNNNQYSVNGTSGAVVLSGTHRFTFELNNSGAPVTFTTPAGTPLVVANDTFTLFYDTTVLASGLPVSATGGTATLDITDFKLRFNVDFGTISVDNFTVTAVPEPSVWMAFAAEAGLFTACLLRRRVLKRRASHA